MLHAGISLLPTLAQLAISEMLLLASFKSTVIEKKANSIFLLITLIGTPATLLSTISLSGLLLHWNIFTYALVMCNVLIFVPLSIAVPAQQFKNARAKDPDGPVRTAAFALRTVLIQALLICIGILIPLIIVVPINLHFHLQPFVQSALLFTAAAGTSAILVATYPYILIALFKASPIVLDANTATIFDLLKIQNMCSIRIFEIQDLKSSPNAFVAGLQSTRSVFFTRSLLDRASATQLASILAHEVAHLKLRHLEKKLLSALPGFGVTLLFALEVPKLPVWHHFRAESIAPLVGILLSTILYYVFVILPFSRKCETDADELANSWSKLGDYKNTLSELHGSGGEDLLGIERFLATHPSLKERLKAIQ